VNKVRCITAALLVTASGVWAQGSDELAALQKQLNELSAKIAQMEQANNVKIAQLESDSAAKIAKLEETDAKNKIPAWVNDTKFKGDFRYRYENIDDAGGITANDKDRQRVRLRVGAYGTVNDYIDYGIRVASGDKKDATSTNQDIGDDSSKKEIWLDQMYVDIHPEMFKGAHLFLGKMPQPWIGRTGLIWDGDVNPEGIAVTYAKQLDNVTLSANGGGFIVREAKGDDCQLLAGQLVADTTIGDYKVQLGMSDFYFNNAEVRALATATNNTLGGDFHLVEGFGSVSTKIANLPVAFNGQYVVNVEAADSDQDTAYLLGFSFGKAKDKGTWEAGYNWRDVQRDAVVDLFNDSDFANGATGHHGHSFWAKYQIAKNWQAGATYLMAVNNAGDDMNTLQLDLNFKF
jgi:hypothetical protein